MIEFDLKIFDWQMMLNVLEDDEQRENLNYRGYCSMVLTGFFRIRLN